jgi:hypothetical protein
MTSQVVCCTGIPNEEKLSLQALVSAMGGNTHKRTHTQHTTHTHTHTHTHISTNTIQTHTMHVYVQGRRQRTLPRE